MTETESYAIYTPRIKRAHDQNIYRDTPLNLRPAKGPAATTVRPVRSSLLALTQQGERASDGILIGLAALTLPAVAYSFLQLWSLLAGGSLNQAVRAFLP